MTMQKPNGRLGLLMVAFSLLMIGSALAAPSRASDQDARPGAGLPSFLARGSLL